MPKKRKAGKTVLLVEDYDDTRPDAQSTVRELGLSCSRSCQWVRGGGYGPTLASDLILMDISLPLLDGFVATKYIKQRKDTRDVPSVAITAYGKEYSRAKKPAMKSSTRAKSSVSLQGGKG